MNKPRILVISPAIPSTSGHGSAMRIKKVIDIYSLKYNITLLVINWGFRNKKFPFPNIENCENVEYIPLFIGNIIKKFLFKFSSSIFYMAFKKPKEWQFYTRQQSKYIYEKFRNFNFDKIYIFRLYMAPFAKQFFQNEFKGKIVLDLDDIESKTRKNFADILLKRKNIKLAFEMERNAAYYLIEENYWLPKFDVVFVCNNLDKKSLERSHNLSKVEILPNVVSIPIISKESKNNHFFTFLFVGVLDYFPNEDGIIYFCEEVFPILKTNAKEKFEIRFVGNGKFDKLQNMYRDIKEIRFVGYVDSIKNSYLVSDAVIVPLRAGGGTRIKVLEALSFRKPTVSTSKGAEGIDVVQDKHLLIADNPFDFADHCLELINNYKLREHLSENGFNLVQKHYTSSELHSVLLG